MRGRCARAVRTIETVWAPLFVVAIGACASVQTPGATAATFDEDVLYGDAAGASRLGPPSVYAVVAISRMAGATVLGCTADVGGGERCTVGPAGCADSDDATLTLHLESVFNRGYRVTAAAVAGIYLTLDLPDFGTGIIVQPCGLRERYSPPMAEFLASEIYSTRLVPWPYSAPPRSAGDSALAASRISTNRAATGDAVAALQRALTLGEAAPTVTTTAVVEAAFTLRLHMAQSQRGTGFVWNHDTLAYPTNAARLRAGISLLDFAMGVPHDGVDWHKVPVIGGRYAIMFTHTPSIAAMEEMNGTAHYMLGRVLVDDATHAPTCALWTSAHEALATSARYLENVPPVNEADKTDSQLAKAAGGLAQHTDTARARSCRAAA